MNTIEEPRQFNISAPSYAILTVREHCWKCLKSTRMSAVWVPHLVEHYHDDDEEPDDHTKTPATLKFIEGIDQGSAGRLATDAPWMKMGYTEGSKTIYLANHCEMCGTVQGDYFVHGVDGPFFMEPSDVGKLLVTTVDAPIQVQAAFGQAWWMEAVNR